MRAYGTHMSKQAFMTSTT